MIEGDNTYSAYDVYALFDELLGEIILLSGTFSLR